MLASIAFLEALQSKEAAIDSPPDSEVSIPDSSTSWTDDFVPC